MWISGAMSVRWYLGQKAARMGIWPSRTFLRVPGEWETCLGKEHLRQESWNQGEGITEEFSNFDPLKASWETRH